MPIPYTYGHTIPYTYGRLQAYTHTQHDRLCICANWVPVAAILVSSVPCVLPCAALPTVPRSQAVSPEHALEHAPAMPRPGYPEVHPWLARVPHAPHPMPCTPATSLCILRMAACSVLLSTTPGVRVPWVRLLGAHPHFSPLLAPLWALPPGKPCQPSLREREHAEEDPRPQVVPAFMQGNEAACSLCAACPTRMEL